MLSCQQTSNHALKNYYLTCLLVFTDCSVALKTFIGCTPEFYEFISLMFILLYESIYHLKFSFRFEEEMSVFNALEA